MSACGYGDNEYAKAGAAIKICEGGATTKNPPLKADLNLFLSFFICDVVDGFVELLGASLDILSSGLLVLAEEARHAMMVGRAWGKAVAVFLEQDLYAAGDWDRNNCAD